MSGLGLGSLDLYAVSTSLYTVRILDDEFHLVTDSEHLNHVCMPERQACCGKNRVSASLLGPVIDDSLPEEPAMCY